MARWYLLSEEGKMTMLRAGAHWEVLVVNDLREVFSATPAIGRGRIFARRRGALYAFGGAGKR